MKNTIFILLMMLSFAWALDTYTVPMTHEPVYFKVVAYRPVEASVLANGDEDFVMELKDEYGFHVVVDDKKDYGQDIETYTLSPGQWRIKVSYSPDSIEQDLGGFTIQVPGHDISYDEKRFWDPRAFEVYENDVEMPSDTAHGGVGLLDGPLSVIMQLLSILF